MQQESRIICCYYANPGISYLSHKYISRTFSNYGTIQTIEQFCIRGQISELLTSYKQMRDTVIAEQLGFSAVEIIKIDLWMQHAHLCLFFIGCLVIGLFFFCFGFKRCHDFALHGGTGGMDREFRLDIRLFLLFHIASSFQPSHEYRNRHSYRNTDMIKYRIFALNMI